MDRFSWAASVTNIISTLLASVIAMTRIAWALISFEFCNMKRGKHSSSQYKKYSPGPKS